MGTVKCGRPTNLQKHNSPNCEWPTSANPASIAGQGSQRFQGERTRERGARASDIGCFGMLGVLECFRRVQRWKDNQRHLNSIPLWVLLISESFCTEWIQAVCSQIESASQGSWNLTNPLVVGQLYGSGRLYSSLMFSLFSQGSRLETSRDRIHWGVSTVNDAHVSGRRWCAAWELHWRLPRFSYHSRWMYSTIQILSFNARSHNGIPQKSIHQNLRCLILYFAGHEMPKCKAIGFLKGNTFLWFSWECKNHHDISRPYTSSCPKTQSLQTWWEYEITRLERSPKFCGLKKSEQVSAVALRWVTLCRYVTYNNR